eukprot:CAMPEP_0195061242 /NCGR_PEP_ID=MMETSP0448-20130528/8259_1 /TAXON_ID=66468 /ORGANISM="Heterocapsa triquestra, Strain CCMP 448" /LENGTH=102 /DNA_ID=CAMNT_0040091787 /DNA_START=495 /DNA_END=803 /DNA_ORIENTATION=-
MLGTSTLSKTPSCRTSGSEEPASIAASSAAATCSATKEGRFSGKLALAKLVATWRSKKAMRHGCHRTACGLILPTPTGAGAPGLSSAPPVSSSAPRQETCAM